MMFFLLACFGNSSPKHPDTNSTSDTGTSLSTSTTSVVKVSTYEGTSDRDGTLQIPVHINQDDSVVQIDVQRPTGGDVSVEYFYDSGGKALLDWEDWIDSPYSLTDAIYVDGDTTVLGWPARPSDGLMKAGDYILSVATTDKKGNYESGVDLLATIFQRQEDDWGKGNLKVVIAYAEGVDQDPDVVDAVEKATERWKEIYASYGITLSWRVDSIAVDELLPDSDPGQAAYKDYTSALTEREVVLVVGRRIANTLDLYGEAGGIPGPLVGSKRSVVAIGWEANAGGDGVFSADDIELMAETMAHEVGHYLGAYHPVESDYRYWDALDDTPECTGAKQCDQAMGENLMYAYPVCTRDGCVVQDQLSAQQITVFNSFAAVE